LYRAEIEGTILEVCENCLNFGENLGEVQPLEIKVPMKTKLEIKEEETVFVDNYGELVVESRKKMNLSREEFAKKINERESLIKRIESEKMRPDDRLTEKIERFLRIKLKQPFESKHLEKKSFKGELTLGDVVEVKE
jgi:putative transcription factor